MPLDATTFYLSTDGILDLAGGPRVGFGSDRLAILMASCWSLPLAAQLSSIEAAIEKWRGSLPQRDDITIIGFRVAERGD